MKIYAQQGDSLDEVCARYYGRTEGVFEAVLVANPGLADFGEILPHGIAIEMPDLPDSAVKETINLWD